MKATHIRKGSVLIYNGAPYRVIDFHHNTPGKGRAVVQTKLRNLLNSTQTEVRFSSTEEIEEADVHSCGATFMYRDDSGSHFMNSQSYEQMTLPDDVLGDAVYYLQDETKVDITLFEGSPIGISLPTTVVLEIAETEPELRGATATSSPKPAITSSGLTLNVPPFVKIGDKIVVNTDEGKYVSRSD